MKNTVKKLMAKVALASARTAAGTASGWNTYQAKEPCSLKETKKSK